MGKVKLKMRDLKKVNETLCSGGVVYPYIIIIIGDIILESNWTNGNGNTCFIVVVGWLVV